MNTQIDALSEAWRGSRLPKLGLGHIYSAGLRTDREGAMGVLSDHVVLLRRHREALLRQVPALHKGERKSSLQGRLSGIDTQLQALRRHHEPLSKPDATLRNEDHGMQAAAYQRLAAQGT